MNWIITGGCGFIGKNLIKYLRENGIQDPIRVIDNESVGSRDDLKYTDEKVLIRENVAELKWTSEGVEFIHGDILDEALAVQVTQGADVIIHLAANTGVGPSVENPRMDCVTNVMGTLNYLEACRINKIGRFVLASSGAPIGECNPPIHEELPCHPVSPYGASKLAGEAYCSAYHSSFNVDTVALRFGNVYGQGSSHKSSVVAKFIRQALAGETLEIYGDGTQTRDFIYMQDLTRAVLLAATKEGIGGEVFQIATNKETTVGEVTELIVDNLRGRGVENIEVIYGPKRVGDVMRNFSDTTKADQVLGWQVEHTLEDGLDQVVGWFLK